MTQEECPIPLNSIPLAQSRKICIQEVKQSNKTEKKKNEKRLSRLVRGQNQSQSNHKQNPIAQLSETSTTWCLMMMIIWIHHKMNNALLFTRSVSFSKNWAITNTITSLITCMRSSSEDSWPQQIGEIIGCRTWTILPKVSIEIHGC